MLALDCRGQAGRSIDAGTPTRETHLGHIVRGLYEGPNALLYRSMFTDLVRAVRVLMELPGVDSERVGVQGKSQGGGLALAFAALEPRVRAVVSVYPFLCDYRRVWEMDLATDAYEELTGSLGASTHATNGSRSSSPPSATSTCSTSRGFAVTCCSSPRSPIGCARPRPQFAAYNKIIAPKQAIAYPDFGHENLPEVNDLIKRFLDDRLDAGVDGP